ncbi:MAG: DNA polymerase III subunit gamma/tau [Desulfobacterales bacterium]|nr:MAG: DNA polymerase III subunit gamma/tau [Desulfobacterales bacterium]
MSYLVLARKYRPQVFAEVIAQEHVTRTLSNAIAAGRVAHAILFAGPRGTGKTTIARILAKAMNCQEGPAPVPCNVCRACTEITSGHAADVFEIDGASNNSVDQVRELRENIKYMPARSLYKIYIIDEVHMLSTAAFNALLKTLEEPPAHVIFLFATTEPHKIPITILSRCQRHDFRRLHLDAIARHMATLCDQEGFQIDRASLEIIAREAGGSMRDALSLLDQVMTCSQGQIAHDQVLDLLGIIDRKIIFDLSDSVLAGDIPAVLDVLEDSYHRGQDMKKLYGDLLEHFRNLIVAKLGKNVSKLVDVPSHEIERMTSQAQKAPMAGLNQILDRLFKEEAAIRLAAQPKLALEMALIRLLQEKPALSIDTLIEKLDLLRQEIRPSQSPASPGGHTGAPAQMNANRLAHAPEGSNLAETSPAPSAPADCSAGAAPTTFKPDATLEQIWQGLFEIISRKHRSLAAGLAKCSLQKRTEQNLEIEVRGNDFTINLIRRDKNMAILRKVCTDYFGKPMDIILTASTSLQCKTRTKKSQDKRLKQEALSHPLVADVLDIFDGKLVDVKILNNSHN